MIPLILLLLLVVPSVNGQEDDNYDILSAHGGIFRDLHWTNDELAEISALHTTASHHKLMQLLRKLRNSDIGDAAKRRIEKFMKLKRPPKFLETFLSDEDRNQVNSLLVEKNLPSKIVGKIEHIFQCMIRRPYTLALCLSYRNMSWLRSATPENVPSQTRFLQDTEARKGIDV
ncbi:unnamed protein product [Haemonchus placei]|uniref:RxLR effector protein n=1 Tax=Haemonchus placei TaxID=6290 RepID=A0A0N4WHZ0_HAEPC|nr:unnamed protein product [Haemonchus placei]